jgi:hypothetical protein
MVDLLTKFRHHDFFIAFFLEQGLKSTRRGHSPRAEMFGLNREAGRFFIVDKWGWRIHFSYS